MGPLLEALAVNISTYLDFFGVPIILTHRGFWFTINPFKDSTMSGNPDPLVVMTVTSCLGKIVQGEFKAWPAASITSQHTIAEVRAMVVSGNFLSGVVAAHKAKLSL